MIDTGNGTLEDEGPHVERTVAFVADPRATTFLLRETVSRLVGSLSIQRGLVDLTTLSGVAIALALETEGIPYDLLDFGQDIPDDAPSMNPVPEPGEDVSMSEAPRLRQGAAGTVKVGIDQIGSINANLMLIPTVAESGSAHADFAMETLPGLVLDQAEQRGLQILVMCPPEQGVRRYQNSCWVRHIMHVATEKEAVEANRGA